MQGWRIAAFVCFAICGCNNKMGSAPTLQTLPITGKVTLDGKPLAGADVVFMTGDPPVAFAGTTKEDGNYQLQGIAGSTATLQGNCKVTIGRMVKPDGSPLAPGEIPAMVAAVESLPAKYSQFDQTTLSQTVGPEGGAFDFELTSN